MFPDTSDLPDLTKFSVKPKTNKTEIGGDETVPRVIDDELTKLGWSENARLSFLGDVGRENGWNRKTIFGGHNDPKNKRFNRGIISWQNERRDNLDAYLQKQGVFGKNDDDELRAMVRFADEEMKSSDEWKDVHAAMRRSDISTYDASENLRKYIKYVPESPFNSYDKDFRVKNNRDWAEKARSLGLGKLPDLSEFSSGVKELPDLNSFAVTEEQKDSISTATEKPFGGTVDDLVKQKKPFIEPAPTNPINPVSPDVVNLPGPVNVSLSKDYGKSDWQNSLTKLNDADERQFQNWAKQNNVPVTGDYDMRGFYQALKSGDERAKTAINQSDGKLHFPDTWKTPLHKSFSNESIYATENAPRWKDNQLIDERGNIVFDENPAATAKPLSGVKTVQPANTDDQYQLYLKFTKKSDSPETRKEYDDLLKSDFGKVEVSAEVNEPQTNDSQFTIQQNPTATAEPTPAQNNETGSQIRAGQQTIDVDPSEENRRKAEENFIWQNETLRTRAPKHYAEKPTFEQIYKDELRENYGDSVFQVADIYQKLTGKPLFKPSGKAIWTQNIEENYDPKTGYTTPEVQSSFAPRVADLVALYETGGSSAVEQQILINNRTAMSDFAGDGELTLEQQTREDLKNKSFGDYLEKGLEKGIERGGQYLASPIYGLYKQGEDFFGGLNDTRSEEDRTDEELQKIRNEYGSFSEYKKTQDYYSQMSAPEFASRLLAETGRGVVKTAVSDVLKGADFLDSLNEQYNPLIEFLPDDVKPSLRNIGNGLAYAIAYAQGRKVNLPSSSDGAEKRLFFNIGKSIDETLGDDKYLKDKFAGKLANGVGSGIGFLLMGLVAPEASIGTRLGEYSLTSGILGGVTSAGSGYDEAKQQGLSDAQAQTYGVINGILGMTEGFGIGASVNKAFSNAEARKGFISSFLDFLKDKGKSFARGAAEESIQEFVQTTGGKIALEAVKDKDPNAYNRLVNIFARLPKQAAQTLIEDVPVAALTGGAFDLASETLVGHQGEESDDVQFENPAATEKPSGQTPLPANPADISTVREAVQPPTRKPIKKELLTGKTVLMPDGKTGTVTKEIGNNSIAVEINNENGSRSVIQTPKNKIQVVEDFAQTAPEVVANKPDPFGTELFGKPDIKQPSNEEVQQTSQPEQNLTENSDLLSNESESEPAANVQPEIQKVSDKRINRFQTGNSLTSSSEINASVRKNVKESVKDAEEPSINTAQTESQKVGENVREVVRVNNKEIELTPEQSARWRKEVAEPLAAAKADFDADIARAEKVERSRNATNSEIRETANKLYKAKAMQIAAVKREITGELTDFERKEKEKRENSNFLGKEVSVDGQNGKVVGSPFGKVKVQFEDGTEKTFAPNKIQAKVSSKNSENLPVSENDASKIENSTQFGEIKKSLSEIPDIEQPNIRTEVSRKIVNEYRKLYGKDAYTGDLSKLLGALEDANGYHAPEVLSRLNKPRAAADYVADLVNQAEASTRKSQEKIEQNPKSERKNESKKDSASQEKSDREFSSTQVDVEPKLSKEIQDYAKKLIPESEVTEEDGYEDKPHITAKFGLHANDSAEIQNLIKDFGTVEATLGETDIFDSNPDYDVVFVKVDSPDLQKLNKLIGENTENTDTHPEYKPHLTLAYVKKGMGAKYKGDKTFAGKKVSFDDLIFSAKDRSKTKLSFGEQNKSENETKLANDEIKPPKREKLSEPVSVKIDRKLLKFVKRNRERLSKKLYAVDSISGDTVKLKSKPSNIAEADIQADFENSVNAAEAERIANRKPQKPRAADSTKDSLWQFVQKSGGIRATDANSGEMKRISQKELGKIGLVNKNSDYRAEEMAFKVWEAGYLRDRWETAADVSGNELIEAIEADARGGSIYSRENAAFAELENELYERPLTDEEESSLERFAAYTNDEEVRTVFANLIDTLEVSDEDINLLRSKADEYEITAEELDSIYESYRQIALARFEIENDSGENAFVSPGAQEAVAEEELEFLNETEPDEISDDDLTFDFGSNTENKSSSQNKAPGARFYEYKTDIRRGDKPQPENYQGLLIFEKPNGRFAVVEVGRSTFKLPGVGEQSKLSQTVAYPDAVKSELSVIADRKGVTLAGANELVQSNFEIPQNDVAEVWRKYNEVYGEPDDLASEKPQTSFDQTDLFGNKVSPKTEQADLFGKEEISDVETGYNAANFNATARAFGAETNKFLNEMVASGDKDLQRVAEEISTRGKLVESKGAAAKKIVEEVSDALDIFRTAKNQKISVDEVLQQPRLDGVTFSGEAKDYARAMESGKFAGKFNRALSEIKTDALKKVRTEEDANYYSKTLPYASQDDLIKNLSGGEITKDGDFTGNEFDFEIIRRLLAEDHYQRTGRERNESSFYGIVLDAGNISRIVKIGRESGVESEQFDNLLNTLEKWRADNKDFAAAFLYDEALPEEKFHQEDLRSGRTDFKAKEALKQHPIFKQTGAIFAREYPNKSIDDKISEIAAKLATDQAEKYGWTGIENFEQAKTEFLNAWADGILRKNNIRTKGEFANFIEKYNRIGKYADFEENQQRGSGENQGKRSSGGSSQGESERLAGRQDEKSNDFGNARKAPSDSKISAESEDEVIADITGESIKQIKTKNRKFAQNLAEKLFDIGDVSYAPQTEKGWSDKAFLTIEDKGIDGAIDDYRKMPANDSEGGKTALGVAIAVELYNEGREADLIEFGKELAGNIGNAAQELRAAALLARLSPVWAQIHANKIVEKARGRALAPEESKKLSELAENLRETSDDLAFAEAALEEAAERNSNLETQIEELEKVLKGEKTRSEKILKQKEEIQSKLAKAKVSANYYKNLLEERRAASPNKPKTAKQITQLKKDLESRRAEIQKRLSGKFTSAFETSDETLKSAAAPDDVLDSLNIDRQTAQDLIDLSALKLLDTMPDVFSPESFDRWLDDLTRGQLSEREVNIIHAYAYDMTRGESRDLSKEQKDAMKAKNAHARRAAKVLNAEAIADKKERKTQTENAIKAREAFRYDRFARTVADTALKTDAAPETVFAAFALREHAEIHKILDEIKSAYPEADTDTALKNGRALLKASKEQIEYLQMKTREGRDLTKKEVDRLKNLIRQNATEQRLSRQRLENYFKDLEKTKARKVAEGALDIYNLPRAVMFSADAGFMFAQGAIPFLTSTKAWAKSIKGITPAFETPALNRKLGKQASSMMREHIPGLDNALKFAGLTGEKFEDAVTRYFDSEIRKELEKFGTKFEEIGNAHDWNENFMSTLAHKIPVVRQSNLAHALATDLMRLNVGAELFGKIDEMENAGKITATEATRSKEFLAAKYINIVTGKGYVPRGFEGVMNIASQIGSSPRLAVAMFQTPYYLNPVRAAFLPKGARKIIYQKQARLYAPVAAAMLLAFALGLMNLDPEDKDFGVFRLDRLGIKDLKITPLRTLKEPFRLSFGLGLKKLYYLVTGNSEGSQRINNEWYHELVQTEFGGLGSFWRGRLHPTIGIEETLRTGKTLVGEDYEPLDVLPLPLIVGETYRAATYDHKANILKNNKKGNLADNWGRVVLSGISSSLGFGANSYASTDTTAAGKQLLSMLDGKDTRSDQEKAQSQYANRIERLIREGADVSDDIRQALTQNLITQKQGEKLVRTFQDEIKEFEKTYGAEVPKEKRAVLMANRKAFKVLDYVWGENYKLDWKKINSALRFTTGSENSLNDRTAQAEAEAIILEILLKQGKIGKLKKEEIGEIRKTVPDFEGKLAKEKK